MVSGTGAGGCLVVLGVQRVPSRTPHLPGHRDRGCCPLGVPAVGMGFNPNPAPQVAPSLLGGHVRHRGGFLGGGGPPHLKGYPNWMEMALISLVSPSHFTVAPVSPLKEPQAPKAKMAKSCRRGAAGGGRGLETLPPTPHPRVGCTQPASFGVCTPRR